MKILVCADGESHSTIAIKKAVSMGLSLTAEVTALHVIDPWLKTFHDEIYAQGRRQYLEYVECGRSETCILSRVYCRRV